MSRQVAATGPRREREAVRMALINGTGVGKDSAIRPIITASRS